jgi:hypothetical protein
MPSLADAMRYVGSPQRSGAELRRGCAILLLPTDGTADDLRARLADGAPRAVRRAGRLRAPAAGRRQQHHRHRAGIPHRRARPAPSAPAADPLHPRPPGLIAASPAAAPLVVVASRGYRPGRRRRISFARTIVPRRARAARTPARPRPPGSPRATVTARGSRTTQRRRSQSHRGTASTQCEEQYRGRLQRASPAGRRERLQIRAVGRGRAGQHEQQQRAEGKRDDDQVRAARMVAFDAARSPTRATRHPRGDSNAFRGRIDADLHDYRLRLRASDAALWMSIEESERDLLPRSSRGPIEVERTAHLTRTVPGANAFDTIISFPAEQRLVDPGGSSWGAPLFSSRTVWAATDGFVAVARTDSAVVRIYDGAGGLVAVLRWPPSTDCSS